MQRPEDLRTADDVQRDRRAADACECPDLIGRGLDVVCERADLPPTLLEEVSELGALRVDTEVP